MTSLSCLLELESITKSYPGVVALKDVSVKFEKGEVHALLGENGAGKSTLIKVLSGAILPDKGKIIMDGTEYSEMTPKLAQSLGISVIYQEFNLVPSLSIAENIFLGSEIRKGIRIDKAKSEKMASEILARLGVNLDPATPVNELSVAYQQIVEISKAISKNARVLVMDEPTAPLTTNEVDALFAIIKALVAQNVTVIYISHRMEELFAVSDRITILRDGGFIDTLETATVEKAELIKLMVGRSLTEQYPKQSRDIGPVMLETKKLCTKNMLKDINFTLRSGEILGISGLVGAGRTELARALFGADKIQSGEIYLHGKRIAVANPEKAIANGIALIPEDRKRHGILLDMSVAHNITIASIKKLSQFGIVRGGMEGKVVDGYIGDLHIKTPTPRQISKNLSGGNQQKVVIAKWLASKSMVYLFDEPTRGIDVGAKYEIYLLMNKLAREGNAIIMISSELPEILGMSDRILVMHEGRIAGELQGKDADQDTIMRLASGL